MPNLGFSHNVTPTTGVAVGKLVPLGSKVAGLADRPIAANTLGAVDLTPGRRVTYAKPTGAGTNYAQGSKVYWFNNQVVTGVTGSVAGFVAKQPATTDTTVDVLLWPGA